MVLLTVPDKCSPSGLNKNAMMFIRHFDSIIHKNIPYQAEDETVQSDDVVLPYHVV